VNFNKKLISFSFFVPITLGKGFFSSSSFVVVTVDDIHVALNKIFTLIFFGNFYVIFFSFSLVLCAMRSDRHATI